MARYGSHRLATDRHGSQKVASVYGARFVGANAIITSRAVRFWDVGNETQARRSRTRPSLAVALAIFGSTAAFGTSGGCSGINRACTQVGCESGVSFRLGQPPQDTTTIERCANEVCDTDLFGGAMPFAFDSNDRITTASVRFLAADGSVLLEASYSGNFKPSRLEPNGPECGPLCRVARFRLTRSGTLEPWPIRR